MSQYETACPRCSGEGVIDVDQQVQEVGLVATLVPCPECSEEKP